MNHKSEFTNKRRAERTSENAAPKERIFLILDGKNCNAHACGYHRFQRLGITEMQYRLGANTLRLEPFHDDPVKLCGCQVEKERAGLKVGGRNFIRQAGLLDRKYGHHWVLAYPGNLDGSCLVDRQCNEPEVKLVVYNLFDNDVAQVDLDRNIEFGVRLA